MNACLRQFRVWSRWYDSGLFQWYFRKFEKAVVDVLKDLPENVSILDVGCGTGNLLVRLRERFPNARLAGVDPTPEMIARAKSKVPDANLREGVGESLPFPDAAFDAVTCVESLHHHRDQRRSVREMVRVLKPGGTLIIVDPDATGVVGTILYRILGRIIERDVRFLTLEEMENLSTAHGMSVILRKHIARAFLIAVRK